MDTRPTFEQIMAMPAGPELDLLVATHAMGYAWYHCGSVTYLVSPQDVGRYCLALCPTTNTMVDAVPLPGLGGGYADAYKAHQYSRDPGEALAALDALTKRCTAHAVGPAGYQIQNSVRIKTRKPLDVCEVVEVRVGKSCATADTTGDYPRDLCLAIARVALLLPAFASQAENNPA